MAVDSVLITSLLTLQSNVTGYYTRRIAWFERFSFFTQTPQFARQMMLAKLLCSLYNAYHGSLPWLGANGSEWRKLSG